MESYGNPSSNKFVIQRFQILISSKPLRLIINPCDTPKLRLQAYGLRNANLKRMFSIRGSNLAPKWATVVSHCCAGIAT